MFIHERAVPAGWQDELESIVPRSSQVNWLQIVWEPGMTYEPVQRWEIREMVPKLDTVPDFIREDLERAESPRERGVWVEDQKVPGHRRWLSSSVISLTNWQLFHQTRCFSQRYWIIQGSYGGHKYRLEPAEQNMLAARYGQAIDTPPPGDLPYAEWDRRVAEAIGRGDKLKAWESLRGQPWDTRAETKTAAGLIVQGERWQTEQRYAAEMLRWLENQVSEAVNQIPKSMLPGPSELVPGDRRYNADEDALDRELIEVTASAPRPEPM